MSNALRVLLFFALVVFAEFYSFIVVKAALKHTGAGTRTVVMALYILISLLSWVVLFSFRAIDWDNYPMYVRTILIAFIMGFFIGKLLVFAVMLIDDVRRLVLYIAQHFQSIESAEEELDTVVKGTGITRSVFLTRLALSLGAASLVGFIYGISNRYRYRVKKVSIAFPNLPSSFKGLRIVQLSDIHTGSFDDAQKVAKGVALAMAQKPDIIFFTGDLVNNKHEEVLPYLEVFSKLKAPLGVYSVLGNHDYGDYVQWPSHAAKAANLEQLKQAHARMGWRLLMNEHVVINKGEDKIAVLGIENWSDKARFPKYGRMDVAYKGLEEKKVALQILLSHDPSHWDAQVLPDYPNIDLTLSGHTHGMQFGVEIPGFRWSPVQFVYKKWMGLYQEGKQYLYVNRGFGFLGYPGRLGIMPEITVIDLV